MAVLQEFARCHCCGRKVLLVCSVTMWVTEPNGMTKQLLTLCQDCVVFDPATDAMGTSTFGQGITKMIKTSVEEKP